MKKVVSFFVVFAFAVLTCSPVQAAPRAGIIDANDESLDFNKFEESTEVTEDSEPDQDGSEAIFDEGYDGEVVWVATGLRTDTTWMNSIGSWQTVAQTAPYFTGENQFDFLRFLGDYGAEDADIALNYNEDGEAIGFVLSYLKDDYIFQVVTLTNGTIAYSSSFGAIGLDGLLYSAMTEADYWRSLGNEAKMIDATRDSLERKYIVDTNEGFFMTDEIFNDFILVTTVSSKMIYPEDTKGELIPKLCPFDGLMPHFIHDGNTITALSAKHTTIATYGSGWDSFYDSDMNDCEDMGN